MSLTGSSINSVKPLNLQEERAKFFNDTNYNPQFTYTNPIDPATLQVWGEPKQAYFEHSARMMEYWNTVGKNITPTSRSPKVTPEFINAQVQAFNERYQLKDPVTTIFSDSTVARCMLKGNTLVMRSNLEYTENTFRDVLRHELETHYLRRHNHVLQPWGNQKFPDPVFRRTEEGLANLHTFLFRQKKLLYKSYRMYISTYIAQHGSFAEIFHRMIQLEIAPEIAFLLAVRTKRGLTDTSQPGGLTKDISYLEGSVAVWNWIMHPEHDPHDLYLGRMSVDQIAELKPLSTTEGLLYPSFFEDMPRYKELIAEIGTINQFDELFQQLQ